MAEIITISVNESVSQRFRRLAAAKYGKKKGSLGKAVTEALEAWNESTGNNVNAKALETLRKGYRLGGIKAKDRSAWHER